MTSSEDLTVPEQFSRGSQFLLLDNRTTSPRTARGPKRVTLRVDPNGHILYWKPRAGESCNHIFIQDIVDIRAGEEAAHDYVSLKEIGSSIQLLMTVVSNEDFVHPVLTTFLFLENKKEGLKAWVQFLFRLSVNTRRRHFGVIHHIRKVLAPVFFTSDSSEVSLEHLRAALPFSAVAPSGTGVLLTRYRSNSTEGNTPLNERLPDDELVKLMLSLGETPGLRKMFDELCENGDATMSRKSFLRFLQTFQRDPRLNEARHPPISQRGMDIMLRSLGYQQDIEISFEVFVHYLWSEFCVDFPNIPQEQVADSMHEPLSHYFINSSHNTYCTGLQVKGAHLLPSSGHKETVADVEIYRQILLSGCRCVELDCWDGSDGPVITHGPAALFGMNEVPLEHETLYRMVSRVAQFEETIFNDFNLRLPRPQKTEVCLAINESAFKTSPYPVLLSIENHLCHKQQKQMVQTFRETFGDRLLADPLDSHPLAEGQLLPSPHALKYKIIIKAKKAKPVKGLKKKESDSCGSFASEGSFEGSSQSDPFRKMSIPPPHNASELALLDKEVMERQLCPVEEELSSKDLSKIVNYLTAGKVPQKWNVDRRFYLMCSLSESDSMRAYTQRQANNLIKHTSRRLVRVFPANMRVTSDNFLPKIHWMMGIQMAALNFQTNCTEMLLNHAMFEQTVSCGYVRKPDCLCDPSLELDIYERRVPHRLPVTLKVTVISCLFLPIETSSRSSSYYVTLDLLDFPPFDREANECAYSRDTTGIHTSFESKQVVFKKILMAETAFLQICIWRRGSSSGTPIAYRTLPISRLQNGYRHVILRSIGNRNLGPFSLFMYFDIYYYVLKTQISIHSALMNPFSRARKDESLALALRHPFMKCDDAEDEEEEENLQAIVGTASRSRNGALPTPPPSPTVDSFNAKVSKTLGRIRHFFTK